jgi:hypothetical protein
MNITEQFRLAMVERNPKTFECDSLESALDIFAPLAEEFGLRFKVSTKGDLFGIAAMLKSEGRP